MEYTIRKYPLFSACGLNCGLCPRFYTEGSSRCPGCAGEGFSDVHPSCGILSCCQRKGIEYCYECEEFPCKKYDNWDSSDSFITHRNYLADMEKAGKTGIEAYKKELNAKVQILEELLADYNDGRRKNLFCIAVNLLEPADLDFVMEQIRNEAGSKASLKEKAKTAECLLNTRAEEKGITLKLRK